MSSHVPDLLTSIFSTGQRPGFAAFSAGPVPMKARGEPVLPFDDIPPRRRTAIWDMHASVHCSIIGTCLTVRELRRLLIKLSVAGAETADDHDLHKQAVSLAGRPQNGARLLQKALDRRHKSVIRQCGKLRDEEALLRFWEEAVKQGDIPGTYWAVLSHPAATDKIMRRAFGDVHMLSHMVGAANRADIRRLCRLEADNAALSAKLEAQQRQLRDGFTARDAKIRLLNEALSRALVQAPVSREHDAADAEAAKDALVDLDRRLSREMARCERLAKRTDELTQTLAAAEQKRQQAEEEAASLRREISLVEAQLDAVATPDNEGGAKPVADARLGQLAVLYVGGRAHQVPVLRAVVERAGGDFLHHDGGIEHSIAILPGLIRRADCVAFPIDCVSHDAMATVKRQCRQAGKPFIPLRTSSLASLLAGIATLRPGEATAC